MINIKISDFFSNLNADDVKAIIKAFDISKDHLGNGKRNQIKKVTYKEMFLNVKAFKLPSVLNQFIYGYIRKSKAQRSFEYASKLAALGVGSPQPLAYYEHKNIFGLLDSYYISEQLSYDLTYRELVKQPDYPNHESILREFTRFTFNLHEKSINFLDHSPGNTLIVIKDNKPSFYLVDLNRMKFEEMSFYDRMQNFSRLTPKQDMVKVMSDEYSKISGINFDKVYNEMWASTQIFREKSKRKKQLKKRFLFKK
jgi:hypothetical protein